MAIQVSSFKSCNLGPLTLEFYILASFNLGIKCYIICQKGFRIDARVEANLMKYAHFFVK